MITAPGFVDHLDAVARRLGLDDLPAADGEVQ
jgi:hypothetical protein